jgi:hypothetical protein
MRCLGRPWAINSAVSSMASRVASTRRASACARSRGDRLVVLELVAPVSLLAARARAQIQLQGLSRASTPRHCAAYRGACRLVPRHHSGRTTVDGRLSTAPVGGARSDATRAPSIYPNSYPRNCHPSSTVGPSLSMAPFPPVPQLRLGREQRAYLPPAVEAGRGEQARKAGTHGAENLAPGFENSDYVPIRQFSMTI